MLRLKYWLLFVFSFLIIAPGVLLAQTGGTMTLTRDEQLGLFAPGVSGQTGLWETVTADTLRRGDLSFGI